MGQARLDLRLDIILDLRPGLGVGRGVIGDERTQVPGFDGGDDTLVGETVKVVGDWSISSIR